MDNFVDACFNMTIVILISLLFLILSFGITGAFSELQKINNEVCNCNCCSLNNN